MRLRILIIGIFMFFYAISNAQPDGYYDGTDGLSGEELKQKLHHIIKDHQVRTYSEFRDIILPDLDEDPDNPDNIILFYKNNSIPKDDFASNNEPDFWNREHTWPSSHGFSNTSDTAYTDVHNLRPSDATVNSSKSNKDFNDVEHIAENEEGEAPDTYTTSDFWEPRDEIKGDVARILLYMDTRYGSERLDLEVVDRETFTGDPELGVLITLLRWHSLDPVDDAERERHEGAYGYQGNRNPFVDNPDFVASIWGDASEPFITLDKLNFNEDFGAVAFGESLSQTYGINGYNLQADLTVSVEVPFSLSTDGETFSNSVTLSHVDGETSEDFQVYLKFEPSEENGLTYSNDVLHQSTNLDDFTLTVTAKEGQVALQSIADAREEDLGEKVRISGVVIDAGNNSSNSRVIYDGTAGIIVRSFDEGNESANLVQGDSVEIIGGLSEFRSVLQIEESPITIDVIKQGASLPEPQVVTISEINESFESELVLIEGATFDEAGDMFAGGGSAGNFTIRDETGSITFRIGSSDHPIVGTAVPDEVVNVTGFIGQFDDDYQVSIRTADDLEIFEAEILSISEARTFSEGEVIRVKGIVIGGVNNNDHNRVIYDGTAGLVVRSLESGNESANLQIGDSAIVEGGILDYFGLFEIESSPTIEILNSGNELPEAQEIEVEEVGEEYESELVFIRDLTFVESGTFSIGTYNLTNGEDNLIFRIGISEHPLVGTEIPNGLFDITGYIGQDEDEYEIFVSDENSISNLRIITSSDLLNSVSFSISPNPVTDFVKINVGGKTFNWELIDLKGKPVMNGVSNGQVDLRGAVPGFYVMQFRIGSTLHLEKVIVK